MRGWPKSTSPPVPIFRLGDYFCEVLAMRDQDGTVQAAPSGMSNARISFQASGILNASNIPSGRAADAWYLATPVAPYSINPSATLYSKTSFSIGFSPPTMYSRAWIYALTSLPVLRLDLARPNGSRRIANFVSSRMLLLALWPGGRLAERTTPDLVLCGACFANCS